MDVELYRFPGSNACLTVERLLDHVGIEWRERRVRPAFHVLSLRRAGFDRPTVPAAVIDGERVQGSRTICARIAAALPDSGLLPADPELRARVLEADATGEQLQNAVRRVFYVLAQRDPSLVMPLVDGSFGAWPRWARRGFARLLVPMASKGHAAKSERIDGYLDRIASLLTQFDELVAAGVLGSDRPTVADFQIGPNLAALALDPGMATALRARPCWQVAERTGTSYGFEATLAAPPEWAARLSA